MVNEWPPKVWHGVIDPVTGEKIPPVKLGDNDGCEACKRIRSGVTWTGRKPPKCPKHRENNVTYTGGF